MTETRFLGLDIGGTKCAVALGDEAGRVLDRRAFSSGPDVTPERLMSALYERIDACLAQANLTHADIAAIGISCGGPLNSKEGTIDSPPNLPLLDHVPIVRLLEQRYQIPAFLQNDANACALAEWRFGAGRGCNDMVFLTFGTGLGAGLILDGRLHSGANGMAGEVGHIRVSEDGPMGYGKRGSLEGFCSGGGLRQLGQQAVREAAERGEATLLCPDGASEARVEAKDIVAAADQGDFVALRILDQSATYLGKGLSLLIDILNPERIVIGSIYSRAEKFFRSRVLEVIRSEALHISASACEILPAKLGDDVGDVASLCIAIDGLGKR